jgi:hypothetical protein
LITLKKILPTLAVIALLTIVAVAAASYFAFDNTGTVATINVAGFLEAACITPLSSLTWPPIAAGESSWQLIYVNSTGTIPAVLNLTTTTWTPPEAEALVTYDWDIEGVTINPNSILQANLTLTLAPDMGDVTTFSFTAVVNAEEP